MKKTVEFNLKHAEGTEKDEVKVAKRVVHAIDLHAVEEEGLDKIGSVKAELSTLEKSMTVMEVQLVKRLVDEQIDFSEKKSGEELVAIRRSVEMIGLSGLEAKSTDELRSLKHKLEALKGEIPEKKKKGLRKFFGGSNKSRKPKKGTSSGNALAAVITVTSGHASNAKDEEQVETFLPPSLSYGQRSSDGIEAKLQVAGQC